MRSFKNLSITLIALAALFLGSCKPDPSSQPVNVDSGTGSAEFTQEGGTITIGLYANRDWTASIEYDGEDKDWLTVTPASGTASLDSVKLVLQAKPNDGRARSAALVIASEKNISISVKQAGVSLPEATPISQVRALYTGANTTIGDDIAIRGIITSDYRDSKNGGLGNATSAKNLVLQDESAGIAVRLTEDNVDLAKGDEVIISLKGTSLQSYRGTLQFNNVPKGCITKVSSGNVVEPISITAAQLVSGEYESRYVAVSDVQSAKTGDYTWVNGSSHTSINFVSKTGETFVVFSSSYSSYKSEKVPTGSGVLKGIVVIFDTAIQISLTSKEDYAGLTGERFSVSADVDSRTVGDYSKWSAITPVTKFYEDFSNAPDKGKEYETDEWMFYTSDGSSVNSGWKTAYYSWNKYMDVAPYNSVLDEVVSYALLPPVNVSGAEVAKLNLKLALYYQNEDQSEFEVVVSENFEGDFEAADWTVADDLTFGQGAEMNSWVTHSVDLSDYASETSLAVALRYTGKSNTYRLDNVSFGVEPEAISYEPGTPVSSITSDQVNKWMELPAVTTTDTKAYISHHSEVMGESVRNYSMLFDTEYRIALWTAYHISSASFGPTTRTDNWRYDPKVPTDLQPKLERGWGESGVDRGHILPSGTRTANYVSNAATFFYTNMTAQSSELNQGVWGKLEEKVRNYSETCDTLYVVTGSVLKTAQKPEISFVKDNDGKEVAKPQAYYKLVMKYDLESDSYKSIAFWYENRKYDNAEPVAADAKSVAWVEQQTGYTFFNNLPESIKKSVKEACVPSEWGL
ncbi:MAG: DNA/RNA non-specific endonuclease [Bacteroidales bacterium]|nr:DNA/RNA non-specific endonuclease [Bacteroidales bacterium]